MFAFVFEYSERASEDVCDQSLARWQGIKGEFESIFIKKNVEVVNLTCRVTTDRYEIWDA
jgi:hypothetical protein